MDFRQINAEMILKWIARYPQTAIVKFERNKYVLGEPVSPSLKDAAGAWINAGWYGAIGWVDGCHTTLIVAQIKAARPDLTIEVRT
jgi:hypothetical protein